MPVPAEPTLTHTGTNAIAPANNKVKNLANLIWNLLTHGALTREIQDAFKSRGVELRAGGVVYRLQTARKVGLLTTTQRINPVRGGRPMNVWKIAEDIDRVKLLTNILKLTPPQVQMIKNQRAPDEPPAPAHEEVLEVKPIQCPLGPMLPLKKEEPKLPLSISLLDLYRRSRKLRDTVDDQEAMAGALRREVTEARRLLIECQATINRASKELFSSRAVHDATARILQKTYDAIDHRENARA